MSGSATNTEMVTFGNALAPMKMGVLGFFGEKSHGQGTMIYPDGRVYAGGFIFFRKSRRQINMDPNRFNQMFGFVAVKLQGFYMP